MTRSQLDARWSSDHIRVGVRSNSHGKRWPESTVYATTILKNADFFNSPVVRDLAAFKQECDVVVANRLSDEIMDIRDKVYTWDLFGKD